MNRGEFMALAADAARRVIDAILSGLTRLWRSALAVYGSPLTWLAVGAFATMAYVAGFGHGSFGKRELRQRVVAATTTRDIMMKRLAVVEAERNTLTDRVRALQESLDHPIAPAPRHKPRPRSAAKE